MSFLLAILLGIIQGLTEFLPVSSSGHLTFFEIAFGLEGGDVLFNILLHLATLAALVIVLRKQIWQVVKHPFEKPMRMLVLASALTAVIGIFVDHFVGASGNLFVVAVGFVATGLLLLLTRYYLKNNKSCQNFGYKHSVVVGIVQGIAVLPGLSRSGSTLSAGVLAGANQKQSAEFSFLLSIPIIVGGTIYEIYKSIKAPATFVTSSVLPMICGCAVAFVCALVTLKWMLKLVSKNKWQWFSIYLFCFAALIILYGYCSGNLF